jgi:hypothetical protein
MNTPYLRRQELQGGTMTPGIIVKSLLVWAGILALAMANGARRH